MFKDDRPFSDYRRSVLVTLPGRYALLSLELEEAREELEAARNHDEDPEKVAVFLTALKKVSFLTDLVELFEVSN